ncbi:unnamed protein product [Ophioblennius macclurei]
MFRNVNSGQSSVSSAEHEGAYPGLDAQESPWIGLLSVLSRPALSLLNRILPGRTHIAAQSDRGPGWLSGLLDDLEPVGAAGLLEPGWLLAGGPQALEDRTRLQHPAARTALHQVLLGSHKDWESEGSGTSSVRGSRESHWWGGPWRAEGGSEGLLWMDTTGQNLYLQQVDAPTKAGEATASSWMEAEPSRERPNLQPQRSGLDHTENLGLLSDLHPNQQLFIRNDPDSRGTALPTPDQDHGYSSLEEEQIHKCPPLMEAQQEESVEVLSAPQCQNKAIAFIMGCPCSDDDLSQSESTNDDGFTSDSSSSSEEEEEDEEEEQEQEQEQEQELDEESERLWSAMSRSLDPYNPQNFCAGLHTGASSSSSSQPQEIVATSPSPPDQASSCSSWDDSASASEVDEAESLHLWSSFSCSSDPYSPLNFQAPLRTRAPPVAPPAAPLRCQKTPQTPASPHLHPAYPPQYREEAAEERLDSGFSELSSSSTCTSTSTSCRLIKQVRFSDQVEEFFATGGGEEEEEEEDRRGPWEELARDRCRFLRRCLEVEQSIGFVLQPLHRLRVYQRLSALH